MSDIPETKVMYLKTHRSGAEVLIAVCDCEIMGKKFTEGPLQVEIYADFFGEQKATHEEIKAALAEATLANFVGCCAVEYAIELGYVNRENVLSIDGILCAQMVLM
jgi:hypothetical protein